jgi:DeoR/GlpR family transcriptional regulator of sugar metabolism
VSEKTVKRDFAYLRKNGLVKRAGSDKKGYYVLAAGQQNIHAGKSPSRRQKGGAE